MAHSKNFNKVKKYYDEHLWNKAKVRNMVIKGVITAAEYQEITSEPYEE